MSQTEILSIESHLFAEELLSFVRMHFYSPIHFQALSKHFRKLSPLTNSMRSMVLYHIHIHDVEVKNIFNSLLDCGNLNIYFQDFSQDMVKEICQRKYCEKDMLLFCSTMSMLAILAYNSNFRSCLDHAVSAIVSAFQHFQSSGEFTKNGWRKMEKAIFTAS